MSKEEKLDLDRIGLFKEMSYLHGVEHVPFRISFNEASHKGKQMLTRGSKLKAGNQDGYFEKEFIRIFEGEGYNDPIRLRRKFRLEQAAKNRPGYFKPSSPIKLPSGLGSYYGTFEKYNKKPLESFSPVTVEAAKHPFPGKNVITNPPKKGTGYGYPNVTIAKMPPYLLEEEYKKLKENPPEAPKKPEVPEKRRVFYLGMKEKDFFDRNPFFTKKPQPIYRDLEKEQPPAIPFLPPSPAKKDGGMKAGCLNKFPEYMSSPYVGEPSTARGDKEVVNSSGKHFVPVPAHRVYPITSILDTNVKKVLNINNYNSVKGVLYCRNS